MAWTYTTLKQALQDYAESDDATFVANIDNIIKQAEDRILNAAQLPVFRAREQGTTTSGNQYLAIPSDFLAPYSLAMDSDGWYFLLFKKPDFIRAAYPVIANTGIPKHYGIYRHNFFILGPTPNSSISYELVYFYRPRSIVDDETSWLGTNAESVLFQACLLEAYGTFLRGDEDVQARIQARYDDGIAKLKMLGEGRDQTDEHRSG